MRPVWSGDGAVLVGLSPTTTAPLSLSEQGNVLAVIPAPGSSRLKYSHQLSQEG